MVDHDYEDSYYYVGDYYDEQELRAQRRRRIFLTIVALIMILSFLAYSLLPVIQALTADPTPAPIQFTTPQPRI